MMINQAVCLAHALRGRPVVYRATRHTRFQLGSGVVQMGQLVGTPDAGNKGGRLDLRLQYLTSVTATDGDGIGCMSSRANEA